MKRLAGLSTLALVVGTVSGCSWLWGPSGYFRDRSSDYLESRETAPMQLPEGVQSKPLEPLLPLPVHVTASTGNGDKYEVPRPGRHLRANAETMTPFTIQRSGSARWLVAMRPPAEVWGLANQFFELNGFRIVDSKPQLGEFVTAWQPLTQLSDTLTRRLTSRVAEIEPDSEARVRVRVEPGIEANSTEVYLLSQVRPQGDTSEPAWPAHTVVPSLDFALLDEMLASMARGEEEGGSVSLLAANAMYDTPPAGHRLGVDGSGNPVLTLQTDLDRAWVAVGRALERSGIAVDDINRSLGVYYIQAEGGSVIDASENADEPGFFARLFGRSQRDNKDRQDTLQRYEVRLTESASSVQVTVDKDINASAPQDLARSVLERIQETMNHAVRNSGQRQSGQFDAGERP